MFNFICKKLLLRPNPRSFDAAPSRLLQLHIRRNTPPSSPAGPYFSTESENEDGGDPKSSPPPVVDWLAADKVELTKTLLKDYGFTDTHLSKLYHYRPSLFTDFHPEKTLLPKLEFYRVTVGFSNTDLPRFIISDPSLLSRSLQNQIVPVYSFLKGLLLSDEIVLKTLKSRPRILTYSPEKKIAPGMSALREAGVPHKHILYLLRIDPPVLGSLSLGKSIQRAAEMGFHPNKLSFVEAVRIFAKLSKSTWDKKMEALRKFGLSHEEVLKAFISHPKFMSLSEGNIEKTMDFVVNKMGWHPASIARNPVVLTYSLEKRIIPRCNVIQYLQAKGLQREDVSLGAFLTRNDKYFIDRFVKKYKDDVPGLMDIYLGKLSPQEPILGSNTYVK